MCGTPLIWLRNCTRHGLYEISLLNIVGLEYLELIPWIRLGHKRTYDNIAGEFGWITSDWCIGKVREFLDIISWIDRISLSTETKKIQKSWTITPVYPDFQAPGISEVTKGRGPLYFGYLTTLPTKLWSQVYATDQSGSLSLTCLWIYIHPHLPHPSNSKYSQSQRTSKQYPTSFTLEEVLAANKAQNFPHTTPSHSHFKNLASNEICTYIRVNVGIGTPDSVAGSNYRRTMVSQAASSVSRN